MKKHYLRNEEGKYYTVTEDNSVNLTEEKKEIIAPKEIPDYPKLQSEHRPKYPTPQKGFAFTGNGARILREIMWKIGRGVESYCQLVIENGETTTGQLDFVTMTDEENYFKIVFIQDK